MFFSSENMCSCCKGRLWCGKERCPLLVKFYAHQKTKPMIDSTELDGSSPPGIFIGHFGYPKVFIGPLVPPMHGDTAVMDTPEMWQEKTIDDIVNFRFSLVRGKFLADIRSPGLIDMGKRVGHEKIIEIIREIAMASSPSDVEMSFKKKPYGRYIGSDDSQPFGPSAPLKGIDIGNIKAEKVIEKVFYDTDLKASEAVLELYYKGVLVSKIQKSFSCGIFGLKKSRRFVPTRWSITAVDDIIGKALIEKTKSFPVINEYRVYEHVQLDNMWIVLMLPREWCFELIEAWYPGTIWNPTGRNISMLSDHEFYNGRKKYAEIGGCYYASRLAVNELLNKERRQAGVIVFREARPGYIMPVGVWNVREAVRGALRNTPKKFITLTETLMYIKKRFEIPLAKWIEKSTILKDCMRQKRLFEF